MKEVNNSKGGESTSKAQQYLEGLLKIPFGIFKKEKILTVMDDINSNFKNLIKDLKYKDSNLNIPEKNKYSAIEIECESQE